MLGEPSRTPYDLEFPFLGFNVRVSPWFLLGAVIFGSTWLSVNPIFMVVWVLVMFAAILVHELGHTFAMQYYGIHSRIVIYMMGGLAIPESGNFSRREKDWIASVVISAAGPVAGFIFAGVMVAILVAAGGKFSIDVAALKSFNPYFWSFELPTPLGPGELSKPGIPTNNALAYVFFSSMFFVNILWGIFNLLPVFPLDGGQIARAVFQRFDPINGVRNSLYLSMIVAGGLAIYGFQLSQTYIAIFMAFMAFQNFQMAQAYGGRGGGMGGGGFGSSHRIR